MARAIHSTLTSAGDTTVPAMAMASALRADTVNSMTSASLASRAPSAIGRAGLAELISPQVGFSLRVAPSSINHPQAGETILSLMFSIPGDFNSPSCNLKGQGLFLEGEVLPGTVVAVVPGLTYSRTQYNRMPNFPKIDAGNPVRYTHIHDLWDQLDMHVNASCVYMLPL